jgi:hypothetical protein
LNLLLLIASLEISNDRSNYYSARNGSGAWTPAAWPSYTYRPLQVNEVCVLHLQSVDYPLYGRPEYQNIDSDFLFIAILYTWRSNTFAPPSVLECEDHLIEIGDNLADLWRHWVELRLLDMLK